MIYHGVTLSITFLRNRTTGGRYTYVSDEMGWPLNLTPEQLQNLRDGKDGWETIGTWPVAKHPENVWDLPSINAPSQASP